MENIGEEGRRSYLQFLKQFPVFLMLTALFVVMGTVLSLIYSQAEIFLVVNSLHNPSADQLFMWLTHLGDWPLTILLAVILLFINRSYSLVLVSTMLFTGAVTQLLKHVFMHPRPYVFFEHAEPIYTIQDYVLQNSLSFPSGHTTCVFSLMASLTYLFPSQRNKPWLFLLGLTVAFSRIYLAQHFLKDLVAGAFIGTVFSFLLIWMLDRARWFSKAN